MDTESSSETSTVSSNKFLTGLIVGAVIGVAIGLLYAPRPGVETRRLLREKASAIKEKASKAASKIKVSDNFLRKSES